MKAIPRIISANRMAQRAGVSRETLAKLIHKGLIVPDFETDSAQFFRAERLQSIINAIKDNRHANWRHIA